MSGIHPQRTLCLYKSRIIKTVPAPFDLTCDPTIVLNQPHDDEDLLGVR